MRVLLAIDDRPVHPPDPIRIMREAGEIIYTLRHQDAAVHGVLIVGPAIDREVAGV